MNQTADESGIDIILNPYMVATLLIAGFIMAISLYWWWRIWRGFLAPPTPMCDRGHIKTVNYFWIIVTLANWFIIWYLARQVYIEHWLEWKETLGLDGVAWI